MGSPQSENSKIVHIDCPGYTFQPTGDKNETIHSACPDDHGDIGRPVGLSFRRISLIRQQSSFPACGVLYTGPMDGLPSFPSSTMRITQFSHTIITRTSITTGNDMDTKNLLRQWSRQYALPLYLQPEWLDIVCSAGDWGACIVDEQDVKSATAWYRTRRWGFTRLSNPPLVAAMPLWIRYPDAAGMKTNRKTAIEYRVVSDMIRQFPRYQFFHMHYAASFDNWLPFYWKGFQQTTRYTYVIEDLHREAALFERMEQSARTDIRKAQETVTVHTGGTVAALFDLYADSYRRQGRKPPLDLTLLQKADDWLAAGQLRTLYLAEDTIGQSHAGLYVVRDGPVWRCLLSGTRTGLRSSGALYLLFWRAMQDACGLAESLDLEGSMHAPIERMLRSLGGTKQPYMSISRASNRWWTAARVLAGK